MLVGSSTPKRSTLTILQQINYKLYLPFHSIQEQVQIVRDSAPPVVSCHFQVHHRTTVLVGNWGHICKSPAHQLNHPRVLYGGGVRGVETEATAPEYRVLDRLGKPVCCGAAAMEFSKRHPITNSARGPLLLDHASNNNHARMIHISIVVPQYIQTSTTHTCVPRIYIPVHIQYLLLSVVLISPVHRDQVPVDQVRGEFYVGLRCGLSKCIAPFLLTVIGNSCKIRKHTHSNIMQGMVHNDCGWHLYSNVLL